VVVPVGAFTSLTPEQLRAVLAHELSHIHRLDHLVNAGQVVIETLLFFHPVTWWLSGQVRLEREHCCDDAAVRVSGNPRVFAEALARLATLRNTQPRAVLAANGGSLMHRITRILGAQSAGSRQRHGWRAVAVLAIGVVVTASGLAYAASSAADTQVDEKVVEMLRDSVAEGTMSEAEARVVYDTVYVPGSEFMEKIDAEYGAYIEKIETALAVGDLSEEEAAKKMEGVRYVQGRHVEMTFAMDVLGQTREEAYREVKRGELGEAVASGKIGVAAAAEKMEWIERELERKIKRGERIERARGKVREMVASGELSEEEGREKIAAIELELKRREQAGVELAKRSHEIRARVEAGELAQEEGAAKLKEMHARMAEGHDHDGHDGHDHHDGHSVADHHWHGGHGLGHGDYEADEHGDHEPDEHGDHEPDEHGDHEPDEHGDHEPDEHDAEAVWRKVNVLLTAQGVARDKVRPVMGAMKRIIHEHQEEGDAFELNKRVRAYLVEQGLDGGQIEFVVVLSKRIAKGEHGAHERGDTRWDDLKVRIEGAVSRGEMTREEADAKYKAIKDRMLKEKKRAGNGTLR
jgi:hypothetical protein